MGVSWFDFWKLTPRQLNHIKQGYLEEVKQKDSDAWWHGNYTYIAVSNAIYNAFSKKGTKARDYPEKPLAQNNEPTVIEEDLTEEQIKQQRDIFFKKLFAMKDNFEAHKQLKGE